MIKIKYYKADPSTFVIKINNGKIKSAGKGLSFFYNGATTSLCAIPVNAQEAPFIFNLESSDFQFLKVQGQVTYQITDPLKINEALNFTLSSDGQSYSSDDPIKLDDKVVRVIQSIVQNCILDVPLRQALLLGKELVQKIFTDLSEYKTLDNTGISIIDASIEAITPRTETIRALEAQARESILKEADDAIYARRKAAVEQERSIKDAELQTQLSIQQKEQEIEELRVENERTLFRGEAETELEKIQSKINEEKQQQDLIVLSSENNKKQADAKAYEIETKMNAFKTLPVENLKAMALAKMDPEQLMAMAFETFAQNAEKIGEFNVTPDLFGKLIKS